MTDIGRNDIGSAVVRAVRDIFAQIHGELTRPSVLYRPSLTHDGTEWRAQYGEADKGGITGTGDTPEAAMRAFDQAWANPKLEDVNPEQSNLRLVPTED
ncbi:MAG TPA: hypothetical protein VLX44_19780 [Xanthobacteraceae bacterium]|nr:hypothetical protein [Xanthobacteraceae bacterium]